MTLLTVTPVMAESTEFKIWHQIF